MKKVKDILLDGFWIMPSTPQFVKNGEIPYITSKNIKIGKIDFSNVQYISKNDFETISQNRPIKVKDMLISMIGTLGNIATVKESDGMFYGQNMYLLRLNFEIINQEYFYYFFNSDKVKKHIESKKNKSTQGYLKANHIEDIEIPLPSLEEQKEIADRLDKVSSLIEKRKTQLSKLDQLIKSRFIEMFGDCTNNTNNWAIVKLNDICDVRDGTHDSPEYFSVGVPLITSKNISSGYLDFSNVSLISKEDAEQINKRSKVDKGDVLLPMIGTVGGAVIIDVDPNFCIKNVALIKFTKSNISNIFVREYLNSDAVNAIFESVKNGGTQKFVGLGTIRNLPISIPPISLQNKFSEFVGKVDGAKGKVQKSIDKLETLKKSLMQQYFG